MLVTYGMKIDKVIVINPCIRLNIIVTINHVTRNAVIQHTFHKSGWLFIYQRTHVERLYSPSHKIENIYILFHPYSWLLVLWESGHNAIRVASVVVVQVTVVVHIPEVRSVGSIRRTQPPVLSTKPQTNLYIEHNLSDKISILSI